MPAFSKATLRARMLLGWVLRLSFSKSTIVKCRLHFLGNVRTKGEKLLYCC